MPLLQTFGNGAVRAFQSLVASLKPFVKGSNLTVTQSSRAIMAAGTVGGRAVFAGGVLTNYSDPQYHSDSYDAAGVKQSIGNMITFLMAYPSATVAGNLILAGGYHDYDGRAEVEYYSPTLTQGSLSGLTIGAYGHSSGQSSFNAAYFGIGNNGTGSSTYIDYYNTSLTKSTTYLQSAARGGSTICINDQMVFNYQGTSNLEIFNSSMVRTSATTFSLSINSMNSSASTADYAIFQISKTGITSQNYICAYDKNLTRYDLADKDTPAYYGQTASIDNRVFIAGGYNGSSGITSVTIYNNSLVKTVPTALSQGRSDFGLAGVGKLMIMAAGSISGGGYGTKTNTVEMYSAA